MLWRKITFKMTFRKKSTSKKNFHTPKITFSVVTIIIINNNIGSDAPGRAYILQVNIKLILITLSPCNNL